MRDLSTPTLDIPRKEDDICVLTQVTKVLIDCGHTKPYEWLAKPDPQRAIHANPKLQRFLINRHWRLVLGALKENTMAARYALMDNNLDVPVEGYLEAFKFNVAPVIVRNCL